MDTVQLQNLLREVKSGTDATSLLLKVRKIVYGKKGWNSLYRIDEFELSNEGLSLCVSNRSLGVVFVHHTRFTKKQQLKLVA